RLELADAQGVILKKGQVACELSCGDELLITEMLMTGLFNEMTRGAAAALLSCIIWQEKGKDDAPPLPPSLKAAYRRMREVATRVGTVMRESRVEVNVQDFVERCTRTDIAPVVFQWCRGDKFAVVLKDTSIYEG
ncbi:unnamed protein product, partial [marine sediment metagenome]